MALFGFNIVLTMIVASVIHKISPYYSFGRWFVIRGLNYYTVPSDSILLSHVTNDSDSAKHSKNKLPLNDNITIKRSSIDIPLSSFPINSAIILLTYYYTELKWLLDLFMAVLFVFNVTFIIYLIQPAWQSSQVNLSGAWAGFVLLYTLLLLYTLTLVYLSKKLPKERMTQIVLTAFLFVCSLSFLPMDSKWFDFRFRSGHKVFVDALVATVSLGNDTSIDRSVIEHYIPFWCYITVVVAISTAIGSVLVFPSLNYAKLHFETLTKQKGFLIRTLLHFNYILPLLNLSLWLKPTAGKHSELPLQMASSFPVYRLIMVLVLCSLRFLLFRLHMDTYLGRANASLSTLRAIKNKVTVGELKRKVKSIFSFYGGTCLQYLGPIVVLLALELLSLVSSSYLGFFPVVSDAPNLFHLSVYKALFSYMCWWVHFVMFFMSSFGSLLYTSIIEE